MAKEVSKESVETYKDKIGYKKEKNGLEMKAVRDESSMSK